MGLLDNKTHIIKDSDSGPLIRVQTTPVLLISIGRMFEDARRHYKENVVDFQAYMDEIDDICDKLDATVANKNKPEVMDGRMFTPAKTRPVKRTAENSISHIKQINNNKPKTKKVKEEISQNTIDNSMPTRVLRSRTVMASSSSINSTGSTVIEASTFIKKRATQVKVTPVRKQANTPIKNNKNSNNDVKLTPLQRKEKLQAEKRAELMQKIEAKDRRIEKNKAEKQKMDLLRKAQLELNKTPRSGIKTPAKHVLKKDLNTTPISSVHSSTSSICSKNSKAPYSGLAKAVKKELTKKPPAKAVATNKTTKPLAAVRPKGIVPQVERHIKYNQPPVSNVPIKHLKESLFDAVSPVHNRISLVELSPITNDKVSNNQVDFSILKATQFENFHPFDNENIIQPCIASTFLQETIINNNNDCHLGEDQPDNYHHPEVPIVNETFNIDETKENNYEITRYMSESQMDHEQIYRNGKQIPSWARGSEFKMAIQRQFSQKNATMPDWRQVQLEIPDKAFSGLKIDSRLLERLENREESMIWNVTNL